jgi:membrane protein required for colicin V production
MGNFTVFDILMGILIFLLMLRCARRGFIGEVFSMGSWVLGLLGGAKFCEVGAVWLRRSVPSLKNIQVFPEILTFVIIFAVIALVIRIIAEILKGAAEALHLGVVDKVFGAAFGIIEGLAITCCIIVILRIQPFIDTRMFIEESFLGGLFRDFPFPVKDADLAGMLLPRAAVWMREYRV